MSKNLKIKNSSGDTIVEVLIVLAVLSLAFAISYSTANRALNGSRNAQEHSETQNALNSQIEKLRSAFSSGVTVPEDRPFCMKEDGTVASFATTTPIPASASADTFSAPAYPADCVNGYYHYSIAYTGATPAQKGYFDVRVRWDGPGSTGRQQVQTSYKTYKPTGDVSSGTPLSNSPASINVIVKKIPPRGGANNSRTDNTPACSDAGRVDIGGVTVSLTGTNISTPLTGQTTATASSVNFTPLTDSGSYTATASLAGYTVCPPSNISMNGVTGTNTATAVIKPNCPPTTVTPPRVAVYRTETVPEYLHIPAQWSRGSQFIRTDVMARLNFADPTQPVVCSIYGCYWYADATFYGVFIGYSIYTANYTPAFDWFIGYTYTDVFDHWDYPAPYTEWRCTP